MKRFWIVMLALGLVGSVTVAPTYGPAPLEAESSLLSVTSDDVTVEPDQESYRYWAYSDWWGDCDGFCGWWYNRSPDPECDCLVIVIELPWPC